MIIIKSTLKRLFNKFWMKLIMAKKINHREHRGALLFSLCPSVSSVVFRTIPEDNKKSHT